MKTLCYLDVRQLLQSQICILGSKQLFFIGLLGFQIIPGKQIINTLVCIFVFTDEFVAAQIFDKVFLEIIVVNKNPFVGISGLDKYIRSIWVGLR
jgi:hypothetical protein